MAPQQDDYSTLDGYLTSGKAVHVKNTTRKPGGVVCLSIADPGTGRRYPLNIPRTWIPYNLNSRLSREMVEKSFDLRQAIANGALTLVPYDEAIKELATPEAQAEMDRINKSAHVERTLVRDLQAEARNTGKPKAAGTVAEMNAQAQQQAGRTPVAAEAEEDTGIRGAATKVIEQSSMPSDEGSAEDSINSRVVDVVLSLENQTIQIRDAISEIRSIEADLVEGDYSYIIAHVEESQFKAYARKRLADLRGQPEPA